MIVYRITNGKNTGYQECVFISTFDGIYVESPEDGFFKHPTFKTEKDLQPHLKRMKEEGFKVEKRTFTVKASVKA